LNNKIKFSAYRLIKMKETLNLDESEEHTLAEEMGKELLEWRSLYEDLQ
jgi:hypothetical protein